jgi:four helix bundle protein
MAQRGYRKIRNFRDLEVWRLGMALAEEVYALTREFPKDELYGLTSQMRRAVVSIPSNIAEGFNRYHQAEYRRFLFVALGSCGELETQVELSARLGYAADAAKADLLDKLDHENRMLRNLVKSISAQSN